MDQKVKGGTSKKGILDFLPKREQKRRDREA